MTETQTKLAGQLQEGDLIIWGEESIPAKVVHRQNYRVAMLAGVQTELMVRSITPYARYFYASTNVNAGDAVVLA